MAKHGEEVRNALVRQWQAIAAAVATIDLGTPSRVAGWRNREVVAHLCLQPALLRKLIPTAPTQHGVVTVAASLAGTHSLARLVDASAREAAGAGRVDFAKAVDEVHSGTTTAKNREGIHHDREPTHQGCHLRTGCPGG